MRGNPRKFTFATDQVIKYEDILSSAEAFGYQKEGNMHFEMRGWTGEANNIQSSKFRSCYEFASYSLKEIHRVKARRRAAACLIL